MRQQGRREGGTEGTGPRHKGLLNAPNAEACTGRRQPSARVRPPVLWHRPNIDFPSLSVARGAESRGWQLSPSPQRARLSAGPTDTGQGGSGPEARGSSGQFLRLLGPQCSNLPDGSVGLGVDDLSIEVGRCFLLSDPWPCCAAPSRGDNTTLCLVGRVDRTLGSGSPCAGAAPSLGRAYCGTGHGAPLSEPQFPHSQNQRTA